jgi:quaternary ammonium compound-resistance protein SugE
MTASLCVKMCYHILKSFCHEKKEVETMNWLMLILAGGFEVDWAVALKYSNGFRNPVAVTLCVVSMILSMWFLSISLRTIPMGTAYAIWTGIGAVGSVVAGIVLFGESAATLRLLSVALIVIGTIGLKLTAD